MRSRSFLIMSVMALLSFYAWADNPVTGAVSTVVKDNEHLTAVQITFSFSDADGDDCHIAVFGHDTVTHEYYPMITFLEGDIFDRTFAPGTHTITWLASADREEPADLTNVVAYVRASDTGKCAAGRFLVIDVSGGTAASSYPYEYKHYVDVTNGVYKTDKIVLRELPDGSWAGVYEVTQWQYQLITGATPSYFDGYPMRCVEYFTWNNLVSSTGFIWTLRGKTGLMGLGLPSEIQWEYACRAGAENDFSDYTQNRGKGANDEATLVRLGWYGNNSGNHSHDVGKQQANAWGLFDMHGNVWEWTTTVSGSDMMIIRGGNWRSDVDTCRAGDQHNGHLNYRYTNVGFRLFLAPGKK